MLGSVGELTNNRLNGRMLDRIAAVISTVLNPFLIPVASILIIAPIYADTGRQAVSWIAVVTLFVGVLPVLFILTLFRLGRISSVNLIIRAQRVTPLVFALACAMLGAGVLYLIDAPRQLIWLCIAYVINGIVFVAITPMWKISFHTGVAAGCVTALVLVVHARFAWLFLILPPIAWARVHRKRHTVLQTVVATLIAVIGAALLLHFASSI